MNNKMNWHLLAKYLSGECTDEELAGIIEWEEDSPANRELMKSLKSLWNSYEENFDPSDVKALWKDLAIKAGISESAEECLKQFQSRVNSKTGVFDFIKILLHKPVIKYAAIIFIILLIPLIYYLGFLSNTSGSWLSEKVEKGKQSTLILNDGTKIVLDGGSFLQYPENFDDESREIKLEGEAYIEAAHIPEKPFLVYAENAIVKVLGTKFNVRAWQNDGEVAVFVAEGKVSLSSEENMQKSITLEKGFAGSLSSTGVLSPPYRIDIEKSLAWLKGEIYFADSPLSEILHQIQRWYDVEIILTDSTIIHERLTVFVRKDSLNDALELIAGLTNTKYIIDGNVITLTK